MSDDLLNKQQSLEDRLAALTDQALLDNQASEPVPPDDPELAILAHTVGRIQQIIRQEPVDAPMGARIKTRINRLWQDETQSTTWITKLRKYFRHFPTPFRIAIQFAGAAAAFLLLLGLLFSSPIQEFSATASQNPGLLIGIFAGIAIVLIFVIVLTNHK
jgi:hypothetical protein